ncbi:MAG: hypothetical protein KAU14_05345 [Thermoplasmata archaeon]|nr:hypothetical protein [Thermoplasmata archaeon]
MRSTADIPELCAIRKPAFGKGDHKFMTKLLPSFNGKETRNGEGIQTRMNGKSPNPKKTKIERTEIGQT